MRAGVTKTLRVIGERSILWLKIAVLVLAGLMPALTFEPAEAAQLTSRKVTISTSEASQTGVSYAYSFTNPSATSVRGIIFQYCTTPLGTCTLPTGMAADHTTASTNATQTFDGAAFTEYTGADSGACTDHDNGTASTMYCVERADTTSETAVTKAITLEGLTNPSIPSGNSTTIYVRVTLYSAASFATPVHEGIVAAAVVRQLTVTGRVAERLEFCVGAIEDEEPAVTPADCSAMPTTTDIAIGTIDHNGIYVTPVEPNATNLANDYFGAAMVNTNASGGVVISYFPESASSVTASDTDQLRSFRVVPTDCSNTSSSATDQCFVSAATTGTTFTNPAEGFGMFIPCIDGFQGSTGTNLGLTTEGAAYVGDVDTGITEASSGAAATCQTDEVGNEFFAFRDDGTPEPIVESSTVVDDEMVKLSFGATAAATTPEGSYLVILTYVATPTF